MRASWLLALLLVACADPVDLLRVEVVDPTGEPVAGARVTLDLGEKSDPIDSEETSSRGIAVLRGMPVDKAFRLTVDAGPKGSVQMDDLRWSTGGDVPIRLPAARTVTGRVLEVGKDGKLTPRSGVGLLIWHSVPKPFLTRHCAWYRHFTSGHDGRFEVPGVPEGVGRIELARRRESLFRGASAWWLHDVFPLPSGEVPIDLVVARYGTISGKVLDFRGRPVPGAKVVAGHNPGSVPRAEAKSAVVIADGEGRFRIPDQRVWRDHASVHARKEGPGEGSVRVRALPGADLEDVVVTLGQGIPLDRWPEVPEPDPREGPRVPRSEGEPGMTFRGVAVNAEGRPVPLATVLYSERRHGPLREAVADPAGRFRVAGLQPGFEYLFRARRGDASTREPSLVSSEKAEIILTLHPGRAITGRVVDEDGRPVPHCRLEAPIAGREEFWQEVGRPSAVTDAAGHFRIAGLHGDRYHVWIRPYPSGWRGGVEGVANGTTNLTVSAREDHFESPFFLGGWLRIPEGRNPAPYRLRAEPIGFHARPREAVHGKDERFWINGTPPGLWRISVFERDREIAVHGPVVCGETEFVIRID